MAASASDKTPSGVNREAPTLSTILESIKRYHPSPDLASVEKAYHFAEKAHRGQLRASGEPYLNHLVGTALLACQLKLDTPSIIAGILHDTLEDCVVDKNQLRQEFGDEVGDIVDGVTKLTRVEFDSDSKEEKQAESFRKMLLAMAKDIRVVLVKLCDRLHNMRTLQFLSEEKQRRIAGETQEIYAPLANRLGIHWMKSELEDLCLFYLRPEIYKLIDSNSIAQGEERQRYIENTTREIQKELETVGISASVKGRAKHYASIWQKMMKHNLAYEEVHDILGFRVIVPTVRGCYEALGVAHSTWKPVPGRFKDYIAMPKPNMYQSLHTTVIGPGGQRIEIQIRTPEMNKIAEEGIAAHWRYKESGGSIPIQNEDNFDLQWVKDLVETQAYLKNPDEFIQSVKGELFPDDVFAFTPKGDLIRLTRGCTPIDFAYAVHTDVGHRTTGAKVNGQIVPLDYQIRNGDTIEVLTNKNHVPSKDWLRFIKSSKAKQRVRVFLKSEEHARAIASGIDILTRDLRKVKLNFKKLEKEGKLAEVANELGIKSDGEMFAEIGHGKLTSARVIAKLLPDAEISEEQKEVEEKPLQRIFQRAAKASRQRVGIKVSGMDNILVRFPKCCEPLPGDRIVGFITRGRGVTVHVANCPEVMQLDRARKVDVEWDSGIQATRRIKITVISQDQIGLLANLTAAITKGGANINSAQIKTNENGKAVNMFELSVSDSRQLDKLKRNIELVPGVIKVERVQQIENPNRNFSEEVDDW
jgi:guanosine-3',5'-bis(diphosphate) 3'-pyrophosphohydrolase